MSRAGWIITALVVLVIFLTGALMFTIGKSYSDRPQQEVVAAVASGMADPQDTVSSETDAAQVAPAVAEKPGAASKPAAEQKNVIPAAFVGEWNGNFADCGTGLNDTRLRIEPQQVSFYESDGEVLTVTHHTPRAITVTARYSGEGEVWQDADRMVLSRSGNDLIIDGYTRHRCPS